MAISIRQIHPVFVGEVSGVDLAKPLTRDEAAAVDAGMDRYAVLVFRNQNITDEQQMAFTLNFGTIENAKGGNITKQNEYRLKQGMVDVSNLDKDGKPLERSDRRRMFNLGNRLWHSDSSFRAIPAKYSILSARSVASEGGNTEFADMRAAYDALDDATKTRIAPLAAHHSYIYSQEKMGEKVVVGSRYGFHDGPAPLRPLVKVHPGTGRPSLYIGRHAYGIPGLSEEESESLLATLLDDACQPPRVYAHEWSVGDIVVWDNRCVLHRAQPWAWDEPRVMFHTRISGDPQTEGS